MTSVTEFENPLVSIVMTYYNKKKFIQEQLLSIIEQTYSNRELIIVDDCSTDNGLKDAEYLWKDINNRVIVLRNDINLGVNATFQKGLSYVTGDYIFVCDADDVRMRNKIVTQLHFLQKYEVALVYSDLIMIDQYGSLMSVSHLKSIYSIRNNIYDTSFPKLFFNNHITAPSIAFHRSLIDVLIPFPDVGCQDHWIILVTSLIASIGYIEQPLVYYRRLSDGLSFTNKSDRNNKLFLASKRSEKVILAKKLLSLPICIDRKNFLIKKIQSCALLVMYLEGKKTFLSTFIHLILQGFWKESLRLLSKFIFIYKNRV